MPRKSERIPLIAFYLPQFHPIPENDQWWGKGFTEWTNVVKARPQFSGHYQPHLPADLGFYDLRMPEVRQAQADLAREYGIHGFCYYHYWFEGKRLLERPFDEVLESGKPDFPFCLCWANENWARTWDGDGDLFLIKQTYSEQDDRKHIHWLASAFRDPRYIRIGGKPLFLVYRASRLPNARRTTELWREEAMRLGVGELFLCRVESYKDFGDPGEHGFDAAVEFQPDFARMDEPLYQKRRWLLARRLRLIHRAFDENSILDYDWVVKRMLSKEDPPYLLFPCVTPSWDNTARRKKGAIILRDSTPQSYERWLRTVMKRTICRPREERIVFINAWNEWAEGCHLEPCQKWGRAYLEATKRAIERLGGEGLDRG